MIQRHLIGFIVGATFTVIIYFAVKALTPEPIDVDRSMYERAIALAETDVDSIVAIADSMRLANARADSVARDSIATLARQRDAAQSREQAARVQADSAADVHIAALDSTQEASFRVYVASRDSIDISKDEQIGTLENTVSLLNEELARSRSQITATEAERDAERVRAETYRVFQEAETRRASKVTLQRNLSIAANGLQLIERFVGAIS